MKFKGISIFLRNKSWKAGGAILATESRLYVNNNIEFSGNSAAEAGALYIDNSNFVCEKECIFDDNIESSKG